MSGPGISVGLSPEILAARRNGVGSSDAAAVAGVSPFKSALEVWFDKVEGTAVDISDRPAVKWGSRLEAAIATHYDEEVAQPAGSMVLPAPPMVWHPDADAGLDFMFANCDRYLWPLDGSADAQPEAVLEIKTGSHYMKDEWEDGPPAHVYVQVQHQLCVTGLPRGVVAVLLEGRDFRTFDVPRDEQLIDDLVVVEHRFWQQVRDGIPPAPDETDSARHTLRRMFPDAMPDPVELEEAWHARAVRAVAVKDALDRLQAEHDELLNQFRGALGEHKEGWHDGTKLASWARWTQLDLDRDALEAAHPGLLAKFKTKESARDRVTINRKVEPK